MKIPRYLRLCMLIVLSLMWVPAAHAQDTNARPPDLIQRGLHMFENEKEARPRLDQLYSSGITMAQNMANGLSKAAIKGLEKALPIAKRIEQLLPPQKQGAELAKHSIDKMVKFGAASKRFPKSVLFRQLTKYGDHWGSLFELPSLAKSAKEHDLIGTLQKGTNITLGSMLPTALAGAMGAAVGSLAAAPMVAAAGTVIGAGLGAAIGIKIHNQVVKPVVDKVAETVRKAKEKYDEDDRREEDAQAQADELMALAKANLQGAHALAADAEGELQQLTRFTNRGLDGSAMENLRQAVRKARDACIKTVGAGVIEAQFENIRRLVTLVHERRESGLQRRVVVCNLVKQMSGISQPDALRIWNNTGQYLVKGTHNDTLAAHEIQGNLQQALEQMQTRIETAQNANRVATEAMVAISRYEKKIHELSSRGGPGFDSVIDKISRAEHKQSKARDLSTKALELLSIAPDEITAGQIGLIHKYRIPDLISSLPDLVALRQKVRAAEAKMDTRQTELNEKLAQDRDQILRWQGALLECVERDVAEGTMMATIMQEVGEAQIAVKELLTTLARSDECGRQAQALADGPLLNPGEEQPPALLITELVAEADRAIAACQIGRADDLVAQIRQHAGGEAQVEANRLDAELSQKIALRRIFQDHINALEAISRSDKTTRTQLIGATRAMAKTGRSTGCKEDDATVSVLVEKAKELSKVLTNANQAAMQGKIDQGQSAQRQQALRRKHLADQMLTVLTALQRSNQRSHPEISSSSTKSGSNKGTRSSTPATRTPTGGVQSAECIVDPSTFSMKETAGMVYFIDVRDFGLGTGYKIISLSEKSVNQGFNKPPGMLGSYRSLAQARAVINQKCPESRRSKTGYIKKQ